MEKQAQNGSRRLQGCFVVIIRGTTTAVIVCVCVLVLLRDTFDFRINIIIIVLLIYEIFIIEVVACHTTISKVPALFF
jgi:hypothetical protein